MPVDLTKYPVFKGLFHYYYDVLEAYAGPYKFVARLEHDDDTRPEWDEPPRRYRSSDVPTPYTPHRHQYPDTPEGEMNYLRACAQSLHAFIGWYNDDWTHYGVVISAYYWNADDEDWVELDDHAASLWGIEFDYPDEYGKPQPNTYMTEVANNLADEAYHAAERAWQTMVQEAFAA